MKVGTWIHVAILVLAIAGTSQAADITWNNAAGGDFDEPSNWSAGVPGPDDRAIFSLDGTYTVNWVGDVTNDAGVFDGLNLDVTLNIGSGNTWTIDGIGGNTLELGTNDGGAMVTVTSGAIARTGGATIGSTAGENHLLLTGGSTSLAVDTGLNIGGNVGDNTLTVADGATVTDGGIFTILGDGAASAGNNLVVTGADASLASNTFVLGDEGGQNTATITDNGELTAGNRLDIGDTATSQDNTLVVSNGGVVQAGSVNLDRNDVSSGNAIQITTGGILSAAVIDIGTSADNTIHVESGGILEFDDITVGGSNAVTNVGGVYQFFANNPRVLGNQDVSLTDGVISFRDVTNAPLSNFQLDKIDRSGDNGFRLDNSTNASTTSYTFDSVANTGDATIYQRLELANGGHWTSDTLTIGQGGAILGDGSVTANTATIQGLMSPGSSPGVLTLNGDVIFESTATFAVDLEGPDAGVGYDQLAVFGTIDLGDATLDLMHDEGTLSDGMLMTIIDNDGAESVIGQFAGLNEGTTIHGDGFSAVLTYVGGDGNDVVLEIVPEPASAMLMLIGSTLMFSARRRR